MGLLSTLPPRGKQTGPSGVIRSARTAQYQVPQVLDTGSWSGHAISEVAAHDERRCLMPKTASALSESRDHAAAPADHVDAPVRRGRRQGVSGEHSEVEHSEVTHAQAELAGVELDDLDEADLDDVAELDDGDLRALLAENSGASESGQHADEPDEDDARLEAEAGEPAAAQVSP